MATYIEVYNTGISDIKSVGKNYKDGDIEILSWPSDPVKPEDPANKKDCYYPGSGTAVLLKTESMLVSEYRDEKISEVRNLYTYNWMDFDENLNFSQIRSAWFLFKSQCEAATTKAGIDAAYGTIISTLYPN